MKMDTVYKITVNIKALTGMLEIGNFLLGDNYDQALTTFNSLQGNINVDKSALRLDLIRQDKDTLPILLKSISCTLTMYTENCKIIVRDSFKFFVLENGHEG